MHAGPAAEIQIPSTPYPVVREASLFICLEHITFFPKKQVYVYTHFCVFIHGSP